MVNQELLNYVNQQLIYGVSKEEIKSILLDAGWQENDIDDAIHQAIRSVETRHISGKKLLILIFIGILIIGGGALGHLIINRNKVITPYLSDSPSTELPIARPTPTPAYTLILTPTTTLPSHIPIPTKTPTLVPTRTATPTPTPTPTFPLTPITKNGFLLSGSLCNFDYSLLPQSENNARKLIDFCESIVPKLEAKFGRGPSAPPYKIQFYMPAPGSQGTGGDANASGGSSGIYLSTNYWQNELPDETGYIMAHELTHVITSQHFGSAWLAEAIADYGAYIVAEYVGYSKGLFEPNCYHFSNDVQNQNHVYGCTYKFLKFVEDKYDSTIVFKLNKALQSENYSENLWVQYTGKTFNQLTSECSQDSNCGGVYHGGL